jgi:DNA-binding CsgD family transcriptional regulator
MIRSIAIYGGSIALAAFVLRWLEYRHAIRMFSTELYIVLIALVFTAIGIWVGRWLTQPRKTRSFVRNDRALQSLGISAREYEVLCLLAAGNSNQEIADRLFVSLNTVKTHLKNLYSKLDVTRRTQAIHKSKALRLIA